MTSPSPKKRRTTRPSTAARANADQTPALDLLADAPVRVARANYSRREEPVWLPAGMLAVLATLALALNATGAEPSGWRSAGKVAPRASGAVFVASHIGAPANDSTKRSTVNVTGKRAVIAAKPWGAARAISPKSVDLRFVDADDSSKPVVAGGVRRADYAARAAFAAAPGAWDAKVVPVAYPGDAFGSTGAAQSIAITEMAGDESGVEARLVQASDPDFGAELQRQLEEPFGMEELPPLDATPLDEPAMEEPAMDEPTMEEPTMDGGAADLFDDLNTEPLDEPPAPTFEEPAFEDFDGGAESAQPMPAQPVDEAPITPPLPEPPADYGAGFGDNLDAPIEPPLDNWSSEEISPLPDPPADGDGDRRAEAMKSCAEELAELKANRLSMIDIHIGVAGAEGTDFPFTCSIDDGTPFTPRSWAPITYMWKASALCHKPLYFEQKHVERYGHSFGPYLDPVVAGAHFFTRLPALPYCMGLKAPTECVYTLGHYRPGSCAPYMIEQPGFTCRAAAFALGAWTGGVFVVP